VQASFGDWQLPLKAQQGVRKSYLALPLGPLKHSVVAAVHLEDPVTVLHLPVVLLAIALIVIGFRRLPASYSVFAVLTVGAALTAHTLDSLERYVSSAFPIWICAAMLLARRRRPVHVLPVYAVMSAWCLWYATLALLGKYTP
jgi:hypothetical protein